MEQQGVAQDDIAGLATQFRNLGRDAVNDVRRGHKPGHPVWR
jgi:hypothetical protein